MRAECNCAALPAEAAFQSEESVVNYGKRHGCGYDRRVVISAQLPKIPSKVDCPTVDFPVAEARGFCAAAAADFGRKRRLGLSATSLLGFRKRASGGRRKGPARGFGAGRRFDDAAVVIVGFMHAQLRTKLETGRRIARL
jgi:hypothetical protein